MSNKPKNQEKNEFLQMKPMGGSNCMDRDQWLKFDYKKELNKYLAGKGREFDSFKQPVPSTQDKAKAPANQRPMLLM